MRSVLSTSKQIGAPNNVVISSSLMFAPPLRSPTPESGVRTHHAVKYQLKHASYSIFRICEVQGVVIFGCEDARIVSETPLIFGGSAWTRAGCYATIEVMDGSSSWL
jgi:hypothetical protein